MSRPSSVRRALAALKRLPPDLLDIVVERLIDRLHAAEPDLEKEQDRCEADDDHLERARLARFRLPGTDEDAEVDDEPEDDDQDKGGEEDESDFPLWTSALRSFAFYVHS